MESITARAIFKIRTLPALRRGNVWGALKSVLITGRCRLKIVRMLLAVFWKRCAYDASLLQVGFRTPPVQRSEDVAAAARSETLL